MRRYVVKIVLAISVAIFLFTVLNFSFFKARLSYWWHGLFNKQLATIQKQKKANPNTLFISTLGIEVPVVYVNEISEKIYQEALKTGVVHYPGTALPGQPGNVYIFGHSSDFIWSKGDYKTVFALLPKITIGEDIMISNASGDSFTYKVVETKVVSSKDLSVLDQYDHKRSMLTLQTSYPIGTALKRYIVIAELQQK